MVTTLSSRTRRAAHGKHRCGYCRQTIDRGEKYDDTRCAGDGTVWTWRSHLRCLVFLQEVVDPYDWDEGIDAVSFADHVAYNTDAAVRHGVISDGAE